jgi:hypothetical protein
MAERKFAGHLEADNFRNSLTDIFILPGQCQVRGKGQYNTRSSGFFTYGRYNCGAQDKQNRTYKVPE